MQLRSLPPSDDEIDLVDLGGLQRGVRSLAAAVSCEMDDGMQNVRSLFQLGRQASSSQAATVEESVAEPFAGPISEEEKIKQFFNAHSISWVG